MRIRNSVKMFVGACLLFCGVMMAAPRLYSYYADPVQSQGILNFLNNGQTVLTATTNSSGSLILQQSTATAAAETAILSVSTPTATTPLFSITQSGHWLVNASTAIPTAGANCAVGAGSSDTAGTVVISGGGTSACTITFAAGYANIPVCMGSDATITTSVVQTAPTKTTVVLTLSSTRNDTLSWLCVGR